jgi:tetratricopeptide (TPR) repeat protein
MEQMDRVREIGEQIRVRFDDDRGRRALARLYETTGELDVAIAWGLRAYRENPNNPEIPRQLAELYARLGDFATAAKFEPDPGVGLLWLRGDYAELVVEAGLLSIDYPNDPRLLTLLAFALNARNDSRNAIRVLENGHLILSPGAEYMTAGADEAMTIYVDALQAVGRNDEARAWAERKEANDIDPALFTAWWALAYRSCTLLQLEREAEALDLLERIKQSEGLAWMPLLRDTLCFRRVADEPRYQELLRHLERRQAELLARLPATLAEYGVADVQAP